MCKGPEVEVFLVGFSREASMAGAERTRMQWEVWSDCQEWGSRCPPLGYCLHTRLEAEFRAGPGPSSPGKRPDPTTLAPSWS